MALASEQSYAPEGGLTPLLLVGHERHQDKGNEGSWEDGVNSCERHAHLRCEKKNICRSRDHEEEDALRASDEYDVENEPQGRAHA